jgi:hypothetical protein
MRTSPQTHSHSSDTWIVSGPYPVCVHPCLDLCPSYSYPFPYLFLVLCAVVL